MLATNSYHIMAVNVIEKALTQGALLQNERAAAYGGKADGKSFYHAIRKLFKGHDGTEECKTEYEGLSAKDAAEKLIEILGPFDALGLGVKYYREHPNEQQPSFNA